MCKIQWVACSSFAFLHFGPVVISPSTYSSTSLWSLPDLIVLRFAKTNASGITKRFFLPFKIEVRESLRENYFFALRQLPRSLGRNPSFRRTTLCAYVICLWVFDYNMVRHIAISVLIGCNVGTSSCLRVTRAKACWPQPHRELAVIRSQSYSWITWLYTSFKCRQLCVQGYIMIAIALL